MNAQRIDKSISSLSDRLTRLWHVGDNGNGDGRNDGVNYWKGKKIIPADDWIEISKAYGGATTENFLKGIECFPDSYIRRPWPLGLVGNSRGGEKGDDQQEYQKLVERFNAWYSDYIELMKYRKDPQYGKTKCFGCILNPTSYGITKLIGKALERKQQDIAGKTAATTTIYPCSVNNRFECPYEEHVDRLFDLSEISATVDRTLSKAMVHPLDPLGVPPKIIRLENTFDDAYRALTDRETLDKVLEQHDINQEKKDSIIDFFMDIKPYIRKEDIVISDRTLGTYQIK